MKLFGGSRQASSNPSVARSTLPVPGLGEIEVGRQLDCRGDMCPRPQLLTKKTVLREMAPGEVLELIVDNPSSPELVPTIMADIGAQHLATVRGSGEWRLYIKKED